MASAERDGRAPSRGAEPTDLHSPPLDDAAAAPDTCSSPHRALAPDIVTTQAAFNGLSRSPPPSPVPVEWCVCVFAPFTSVSYRVVWERSRAPECFSHYQLLVGQFCAILAL